MHSIGRWWRLLACLHCCNLLTLLVGPVGWWMTRAGM
jgi:hypothetical protein